MPASSLRPYASAHNGASPVLARKFPAVRLCTHRRTEATPPFREAVLPFGGCLML